MRPCQSTLPQRFWDNVKIAGPDECWNWQAGRNRGYGLFQLRRGYTVMAHRLVALGPNARGMNGVVMHSCDNPSCVNPRHLRVASQLDNIKDCIAKGRWRKYPRGSANRSSKLTEADVKAIRTEHEAIRKAGGEMFKELAMRHGITYRHLRHIVTRKVWTHI